MDEAVENTITFPVVPYREEHGYLARHLHGGDRLTLEQAQALKGLVRGLQLRGARLDNGRAIGGGGDAVAWLLERIAAGDSQQAPERLNAVPALSAMEASLAHILSEVTALKSALLQVLVPE